MNGKFTRIPAALVKIFTLFAPVMAGDDFLDKKLQERKAAFAFRSLKLPDGKVDFCSNDYLGLAFRSKTSNFPAPGSPLSHGSTGSRLLAGNYPLIEETEKFIALFHEGEAGLLFNSGYDANVGLLSCVPQRGDTVIYDYLSHASIRDGIRLSFARAHAFLHNDLEDLQKKLQQAQGNIFVVTESVFSMDGDMAPLPAISLLCEKYHAHLVVDEAHATGVTGDRGEGLVQHLGLSSRCFARIHTFGKAVGCHGAIVLGSNTLRDYLINFSRPFIFSTALPELSVAAIQAAYTLFPGMNRERNHLGKLIGIFQQSVISWQKHLSTTPIQVVLIPGNERVKQVAAALQAANLDVRAILYPTVPKGSERLRIVLHAFNTENEVGKLIDLLKIEH